MIVFAAIAPHPPMSIPGIGNRGDFMVLRKTLESYEILRKGLEETNPDTIIIVSPHGYMHPYSFVINSSTDLKGSFADFSFDKVMTFTNDLDIVHKIIYASQLNEITSHLHSSFLDHGSMVPLFHLTKNIHPKLVHLSFSLMSYERHYRYGEIIGNILENDKTKRVAIIASGDLSHKIGNNLENYFSEEFDSTVIRLLGSNNLAGIMNLEQKIIEDAAECGMRSIMIMLGMLGEKKYEFKMLSYEHPFGVGYLTARLI